MDPNFSTQQQTIFSTNTGRRRVIKKDGFPRNKNRLFLSVRCYVPSSEVTKNVAEYKSPTFYTINCECSD